MNVVAVPVKGGRFKIITQLRTLAQLDSYFSHVKLFIFYQGHYFLTMQPASSQIPLQIFYSATCGQNSDQKKDWV